MVLLLKQWKSRSSPGFAGGVEQNPFAMLKSRCRRRRAAAFYFGASASTLARGEQPAAVSLCETGNKRRSGLLCGSLEHVGAGWSSPVARQAHNLKVAGSNPAPATNVKSLSSESELRICVAPDPIRGPFSREPPPGGFFVAPDPLRGPARPPSGRLFCCPLDNRTRVAVRPRSTPSRSVSPAG
jgi:hypothetical protein